MISIAIPVYDMENKKYFLERCLNSIKRQTYKDYEIVVTENKGGMAANTNEAIRQSKGDIIKILYMDDYLAHPDALRDIVLNFEGEWLVTGCKHDNGREIYHEHFPTYNSNIHKGVNTIGSPSVLTIKRDLNMFFDEEMMWLLDCDFYKRLHDKFGAPKILNSVNVIIGVGEHQATNWMGEERKLQEEKYINKKYE